MRIEATRPATTADTITQNLVRIPSSDPAAKRLALRTLIARDDVKNGIVFCNRKTEVDVVAKSLRRHGLDASPIHGDLDQSTRMKTLADFRSGALKLLCASDVAARGLDIPDVSHVFNYDVPHHADDYVHRIGRTGRAGKSGQTFMLITPADGRQLDKVLKLIGMTPNEVTLDVDFSEIKERPPRAAAGRSERPGRGRPERSDRPRRSEPAPAVDSAPAESLAAVPVATAQDAPAPRSDRSTRGRRGRDASAPASVEVAAPSPMPVIEAAPAAAHDAPPPRERRPRRPRRDEASREAAPAPAAPAPERPAATPSRASAPAPRGVRVQDPNDAPGDRVVGFGSDVPAFLQRATSVRPAED